VLRRRHKWSRSTSH